MPRGTGWGKYKKGKRVLKIKELKEGSNYLSYSKQFNSKNVVLILPNNSESTMFTFPQKIRFMYINPNKKRNEAGEDVRYGEEKRSENDMSLTIAEADLQDNIQNYNLFKIKFF